MASFSRRKNVNVMRVGVKIVSTVIGLYAAGFMLTIIGNVMNGTCSPFYSGLTLIGWPIGTYNCNMGGGTYTSTANTLDMSQGTTTGLLAVIGLLAVVWIVFEFVDVRL